MKRQKVMGRALTNQFDGRSLFHRFRFALDEKQGFAAPLLALLLITGCASTSTTTINTSTTTGAPENNPALGGIDPPLPPSVVSYSDYRDPLIGLNRAIFAFNDLTYRYVLIPVSKGYYFVLPKPAQTGISQFFYNIKTPIYFLNNLLQWQPKPMGVNVLRFGINSTIGLLGLFDPAKAWFELDRVQLMADLREDMSRLNIPPSQYIMSNLFVLYQDILQKTGDSSPESLAQGMNRCFFVLKSLTNRSTLCGETPRLCVSCFSQTT